MKIVCDNCATKYSIADEKVRGKVFKIRCKKCSHIIVVRGGADGNAEASRDAGPSADAGFPGEDQATMAAGAAPMRGTPAGGVAATGDAVWHLVIDREQVGPLTPAEVRTKFSNGEIDVETYAWREGFGDWLRLGSIEDFRDLGAPAGDENATRRTDSADLFAGAGGGDDSAPNDQPAGDLFGGAAASPAFSSAPAPAAASAEADVFGGGGGLFGAPSAAPAPRPSRTSSPGFAASAAAAAPVGDSAGGVDVRPMTGQRNENSVLFSLNNLQALATGGGGAKASSAPEPRPGFANSQTEGSGLIDIRAMAASTLAASPSTSSGPSGSKDDLPGLGNAPVFSPMAAPILMPAAPSGPPKWMWAILGVGVLAVLGIVVVGILLLTRKPEPTVVATAPGAAPAAAAPTAAAPAAAAPAAAAPAAAAPAAGTPAAVAQNDKAAAAAEEKKHGKEKGAKADKGTKVAKADTAPAAKASAPAAAEAPAAPAPKKSGGKHDALDDLLNDASPESKPAASSKKAAAREESGGGADESLPDTLDKGQVVAGMGKVKGNVTACYDQYHVPGMAMVALTISPSGKVSSANVTGQFAGTPTGECVAKAVKKATFPRFKGAPMPINYPYVLR